MRSSMGTMPVRDMVQFVDDMKWLAEFAEHLDKPQEGMKVISTSPIRNDITPKKKAKKK